MAARTWVNGAAPALSAANLNALEADLTVAGTLAAAAQPKPGSGSPSGTTFLRGDGVWATPPAGSTTAAGTSFSPTGTIGASNVQAAVAELDSELLARVRAALLPDGGNAIWTRSTDPGGLAVNGDVWLAP